MESDSRHILNRMDKYHDGKFGFVVLRISYDSDENWADFLGLLNAHVELGLRRDSEGDLIRHKFNFHRIEDRAQLDGATKAQARRYFIDWTKSVGGDHFGRSKLVKYLLPIYADGESINAVLIGAGPFASEIEETSNPSAFVKLLDIDFEENAQDPANLPAIDGCKAYNVGWMKVPARSLVPSIYYLLQDRSWSSVYERLPLVSNP